MPQSTMPDTAIIPCPLILTIRFITIINCPEQAPKQRDSFLKRLQSPSEFRNPPANIRLPASTRKHSPPTGNQAPTGTTARCKSAFFLRAKAFPRPFRKRKNNLSSVLFCNSLVHYCSLSFLPTVYLCICNSSLKNQHHEKLIASANIIARYCRIVRLQQCFPKEQGTKRAKT